MGDGFIYVLSIYRILCMSIENLQEGDLLIVFFMIEYLFYDNVVEVCCMVYDLEILVNIFDFGLIYIIVIDLENVVCVVMMLIVLGCFVVGEMFGWVVDVVEVVFGIKQVDVEMIFQL